MYVSGSGVTGVILNRSNTFHFKINKSLNFREQHILCSAMSFLKCLRKSDMYFVRLPFLDHIIVNNKLSTNDCFLSFHFYTWVSCQWGPLLPGFNIPCLLVSRISKPRLFNIYMRAWDHFLRKLKDLCNRER